MAANPATVEQRRAAAEQALERELRRIVDSGEYGEWFRRMCLFHRYTPANSLWIMAQLADRPDASGIVASYRTWLGAARPPGAQGRAGPRRPLPPPLLGRSGDRRPGTPPASDAEAARLQRRVTFGVGYAFDLSATDGEPLPVSRHEYPSLRRVSVT